MRDGRKKNAKKKKGEPDGLKKPPERKVFVSPRKRKQGFGTLAPRPQLHRGREFLRTI